MKLLLLFLFFTFNLFAGTMPNNDYKIGKGSSTQDKGFTFDTGDGASNVFLKVDDGQGLKFNGNTFQLGDGATGNDKNYVIDPSSGAGIRWNGTDSRIQFTNDGTNYKNIGSGSGGGTGVNALQDSNPDFEAGLNGWTASGGTLTIESSNPLFGSQSASWDSNALGQTLDSTLVPITDGFIGRKCQAVIQYKYASGSAGDYKLVARVFDDSGATENDRGVINLAVTGTSSRPAAITYDCPDDVADDIRVRVESGVADAGIIIIDDVFDGTGRNTFEFGSASLYGKIVWNPNTNCAWERNDLAFGPANPDADCLTPVITGSPNITSPSSPNAIPEFTVTNLPKGKYVVTANGFYNASASAATTLCRYYLTDGTSNSPTMELRDLSAGTTEVGYTVRGVFEYSTDQSSVDFRMFFQRPQGDGSCSLVANDTAANRSFEISIERYPEDTSEAMTLETSGGYIETTYQTTDNSVVDIGTVNNLTPSGAPNANGSITNFGSIDARVPCDGGNSPTGLTCSAGSEVIGISYDAHVSGPWEVCMEFNSFINIVVASSSMANLWNISRWSEDLLTLIEEGNSRQMSFYATQSSGGNTIDSMNTPIRICSTFNIQAGVNTFLLSFTKQSNGTVSNNWILAESNFAGLGAPRNIKMTARPINQQFPTPVFTDLTNSLDEKIFSPAPTGIAKQCSWFGNTGNTTIAAEVGDCIDNVVNGTTGLTTTNFNAGYWTTVPVCVCDIRAETFADANCIAFSDAGGSTARIRTNVGGAGSNEAYQIICHGYGPK